MDVLPAGYGPAHLSTLRLCEDRGPLSDIAEGLNAGMWTIGVTRSGNAVGLSEDDWVKLGDAEQKKAARLC